MVAEPSTPSNLFTPVCASARARGFSLIEALVAAAVTTFVLGAALSVTLSSRRLYTSDRERTEINQNLRAAFEIVGADLRQAGERLPADFPAILVIDGGGGPDTLILRRNLLDPVLPVCGAIVAGSGAAELRVADSGGTPPAGCAPVLDEDADGWPDNIDVWRDHRNANGGAVWVYAFNPVFRVGEFVLYDRDGFTPDYLHRGDADPWDNGYRPEEQCRVYMLEQRTYSVQGDLLSLRLGDSPDELHVATDLSDFQVRALFTDGTSSDSLDADDDWDQLEAIEITISGAAMVNRRTIRKSLTTRMFPRNVLSL